MATIVLFVTRGLWQFQVVRGGLQCRSDFSPNDLVETLPRPVMRPAFAAFASQLGFHPYSFRQMLVVITQIMDLFDLSTTLESSPLLLARRQQQEGTRAGGCGGRRAPPQ